MATRSRTYLPTDWTLWAYTPVAGKFRLDFSTLDGSDVLGGSTDTGSIQALPLRMGSIQLDDGQRPDQSVFSQFIPGTMALSAQLLAWSDTTVKELYNGKQIFLTLKNEATGTHPIFGKATPYFIGQIDSLDIQVDPINKITNLTITGIDVTAPIVNVPVAITKSTSLPKSTILTTALDNLRGTFIDSSIVFGLYDTLGTVYETNNTETKSVGDWFSDYITSGAILLTCRYRTQNASGVLVNSRDVNGVSIVANSGTGSLIPEAVISNMSIGQDGANVPTAFNLNNTTSTYSFGTNTANLLSNQTVFTSQLDVPSTHFNNLANLILQYTQKIQPLEVTLKTAQTYQPIIFDTAAGTTGDYIYPQNYWYNGQEVKTNLTYTGATYYHKIVGVSHTIMPDDWQTTYQLWKGL